MNLNPREIRRLNIKSFFNRRCCRCLNCFLLIQQRTSACTFDHLFVRLPSLCWGVCLSFVYTFLCLSFSCYYLCMEHPLILKLLLTSRIYLARNQNIKEDIPTALEVFLCFETERNETTRMQTDPSRKHPRNTRVISAEKLGTMSKNNLRGFP